MRTTIDKAGRLVIPRSLRSRIGLLGGGEVELELDGAAVRVEPVVGRELREDGGLLFIPAAGTPIDAAAVRELTARQHRRPLVSGDARSRAVYEALGVELDLIEQP